MKFSIKDFFSKCNSFLRIWAYLLKKSLMENYISWAVYEWDSMKEYFFHRQKKWTVFWTLPAIIVLLNVVEWTLARSKVCPSTGVLYWKHVESFFELAYPSIPLEVPHFPLLMIRMKSIKIDDYTFLKFVELRKKAFFEKWCTLTTLHQYTCYL